MNFKNQTILITGGAQGIGLSLSEKFSNMGANVVIADKHKETANIAQKFGGFGYVCDVTQEEQINSFITFEVFSPETLITATPDTPDPEERA